MRIVSSRANSFQPALWPHINQCGEIATAAYPYSREHAARIVPVQVYSAVDIGTFEKDSDRRLSRHTVIMRRCLPCSRHGWRSCSTVVMENMLMTFWNAGTNMGLRILEMDDWRSLRRVPRLSTCVASPQSPSPVVTYVRDHDIAT